MVTGETPLFGLYEQRGSVIRITHIRTSKKIQKGYCIFGKTCYNSYKPIKKIGNNFFCYMEEPS